MKPRSGKDFQMFLTLVGKIVQLKDSILEGMKGKITNQNDDEQFDIELIDERGVWRRGDIVTVHRYEFTVIENNDNQERGDLINA